MKRIIILFFAVITACSAYCQTALQDGDRCFDKGDYACAETKYNEAFKLASGTSKQKAEVNINRARRCAEFIRTANQAFNSKNYKVAKENYETVLKINPNDPYAKTQLEKCNNALNLSVTTTLSVSKDNLSFSPSGGKGSITVTTNASSYSVSALPSWCTVQKYTGSFEITCSANSGTATRTGSFTVTAGNRSLKVNVSQTGKTSNNANTETTLRVKRESLSFFPAGGSSEPIRVYSNAGTYSVSSAPSWCSVQTYDGYFVVTCSANNSSQSRWGSLKVAAGGKELSISVSQRGTTNPTNSTGKKKSPPRKPNDCFNCPKDDPRLQGLSFGYVQKQWEWTSNEGRAKYGAWNEYDTYLEGIQAGVRIEPLFKYGFGLNIGLFYEYYSSKSSQQGAYTDVPAYYNMHYSEHSFYLPLHLEYRLNFSKNFQLFVEGGPGIDWGLSATLTATGMGERNPFLTRTRIYRNSELGFPYERLNASFDFSAGMRFVGMQLNIGTSRGWMNISSNPDIHVKQSKPFMVSLSWMIPSPD